LNAFRFAKKCLTDQRAAIVSAKLVARAFRSNIFWRLHPDKPLFYPIGHGGHLLLDKDHSFTIAICPALDAFEPDLRAFLEQVLRPGDVFLDCGSNIGYFSVLAWKLVGPGGRVISIEANPVTFELLKRNLAANGFGEPVHCALSTTGGEVELFVPLEGDAYSSLKIGGLVKADGVHTYKVKAKTVDQVVSDADLKRVDFIKIDVEGADLEVLRSAVETIRRFRPRVCIEYSVTTWGSFGSTSEQLLSLLADLRYEAMLFDVKKKQLIPVEPSVWSSPYVNLFLCPMK
jgi:FkbM family methyltransferase